MTADVTVLRPVLPMTTFLTGNDVPKEYQTRACAAFALWLEQLGDGNAPLALLHMAEALKAEQKRADELAAKLAAVKATRDAWTTSPNLRVAHPYMRMTLDACVAEIDGALSPAASSGGVV